MPCVQLNCPSTKKTVDGFVIGAHQSPAAVVQAVRIELGLKYAALFTPEAKPIPDPKSLDEGSRILVAATEDEKMLPDAAPGWVMYEGEEVDDLHQDSGVYGQDWENLDDQEKRLHITNLNEQKPAERNKLRITRPYELVQADLAAIDASASSSSSSSSTNPEELIEHCWGVTLEDFLPAYMKPDKFKITANALDPQVLCAIGILSSFTHSQSRLAREVLVEAVALRTDADQGDPEDKHPVVRKQDLAVAIEMVYERAGVLPAKITKVKSEAAKGKEKKKAARDKKKASGKDKKKAGDEEEEEEEEGEPA